MFWSDIDSWGKRKLRLMTLSCGFLYVIFATFIPIMIVSTKYNLINANSSVKLTAVGICVFVFVVTFGIKGANYVIGILPQIKRGQQCLKFSIQLVLRLMALGSLIMVCYQIKKNLETALFCIEYSVYSFMIASFIEFTCLKTLEVQWSMEEEVDKQEKLEAIKRNR